MDLVQRGFQGTLFDAYGSDHALGSQNTWHNESTIAVSCAHVAIFVRQAAL